MDSLFTIFVILFWCIQGKPQAEWKKDFLREFLNKYVVKLLQGGGFKATFSVNSITMGQIILICAQCPLTGFESISYENSKMVCLKILALGISELTLLNGPKKP